MSGLWAALPPLACYTVPGSSRLIALGPESTTALMTAVTVGPLAADNPARYAELATALALLVLAVVAWLVRLGLLRRVPAAPAGGGRLPGRGPPGRRVRECWPSSSCTECWPPSACR